MITGMIDGLAGLRSGIWFAVTTKMITAHSSVVHVRPGIYKLADVLRENGRCKPVPKRHQSGGRTNLLMTYRAIRNRERNAERRKRDHNARLVAMLLDASTILNPDERCELWNR